MPNGRFGLREIGNKKIPATVRSTIQEIEQPFGVIDDRTLLTL